MICVLIMSPPRTVNGRGFFLQTLMGAHFVGAHNCTKLQYTYNDLILHIHNTSITHTASTSLSTTITTYTNTILQLSSPPEFRRKTEKNKKDNNSIFITEKDVF